jgi:pilus assembly protein TadC
MGGLHMIAFLLTVLACAVAGLLGAVILAACCLGVLAIVRGLLMAREIVREWRDRPRAEAREMWRSALRRYW